MSDEKRPSFSIVMPTFNSERTIEKALTSLVKQDIGKDDYELLVIDGGSTDNTVAIAKRFGATIIPNPDKEPRAAKNLGFIHAKGHWIVMQDSDEVWTHASQLRRRKELLEANPDVGLMVVDKMIPGKRSGLACPYINIIGDPFSYIVHSLINFRVEKMKHHLEREGKQGNVYRFTDAGTAPNGDGGTTTVDVQKARELFGDRVGTQVFAVTYFLNMINATQLVGCIPEDNIVHYSHATFRAYLKKLRFRVYYALNDVEKSGYGARALRSRSLRRRKYLFILYAATVVLPFLDSFRLSIKHREWSLLLHFFYTYYVVFVALQEYGYRFMGIRGKTREYGK